MTDFGDGYNYPTQQVGTIIGLTVIPQISMRVGDTHTFTAKGMPDSIAWAYPTWSVSDPLLISLATPEARAVGPNAPKFIAASLERTPTPFVRA